MRWFVDDASDRGWDALVDKAVVDGFASLPGPDPPRAGAVVVDHVEQRSDAGRR
jgi:hypothetical protein